RRLPDGLLLLLALLCFPFLPGACHRPPLDALARFLVRSVAAAPAAVFAHLDTVRVVPAVFVCLVVAALALLASEGYRDSDFSASHFPQDPGDRRGRAGRDAKEPRDPRGVVERIAPAARAYP